MYLYGFTGKKRSGKTTASTYVQQKLGAIRINFKDALIKEIESNFPALLDEMVYAMNKLAYDGWAWDTERLFTEKPPLMRALLQNYGTEVRRGDDPDYWVNQWRKTYNRTEGYTVVDDVRFINEAEAVKDYGGTLIRIIRLDQENHDEHQSETEMDKIHADHTIRVATGDFETLYKELDAIINSTK